MIVCENITKRFGEATAVNGVSFSVKDKQVVGLLGPNGAGKTTTMRILTTFLPPSTGTARVAGFDICNEPEEVRKNIGYLPELPPLYREMTVKEYLTFVSHIKGVVRGRVRAAVDEVMVRCLISDVSTRVCGNLSRGYKQRVGLAAALVHKPKVIILDEPTSGLDPAQIVEIRKLIRDLGKEHTVVLSTHILPEVTETCDSVIIIAQGVVVAQGELSELTRDRSLEHRFLEAVIRGAQGGF